MVWIFGQSLYAAHSFQVPNIVTNRYIDVFNTKMLSYKGDKWNKVINFACY